MSWLVVRTKARDEARALEHLANQGFECYCPQLNYDSGKVEPLFPGYLFVRAEQPGLPYGKIRSTRGVLGLVRFGMETALAGDELVDQIRRQEQQLHGKPVFSPNDIVEFAEGPFRSLRAVYLCQDGEERSVVLLTLLNSQRKITIPTRDLVGYK